MSEISYIKKFNAIFGNDNSYRDFFCPQIMRDDVNQKYNALILGLDKNDLTYEVRKQWYQAKKVEDHDSIDSLEARENGKKRKF